LVEICGLTWMQHLSIPTSLVSTSTATHCTTSHRDVRIPVFYPASHPASCICDLVPVAKNFKFAPHKKFSDMRSICAQVRVTASDYVTIHWPSLSEVTTTAIHCVQFRLRGKEIADKTDDIQTIGGTWSLRILALSDTDYCMILLILGEWQYRVIVQIARHLISILLPSPPHTHPLPIYSQTVLISCQKLSHGTRSWP